MLSIIVGEVVLDFGIAKLVGLATPQAVAAGTTMTASPAATSAARILGAVSYMRNLCRAGSHVAVPALTRDGRRLDFSSAVTQAVIWTMRLNP